MHMAIWHVAYVRGIYPRKKMFESNPLTTRARLRLLFADGRIRTCAGEAYLISFFECFIGEMKIYIEIYMDAPFTKGGKRFFLFFPL